MTPDLSFVVPVYNEQDSVVRLVEEIAEVCTRIGKSWELFFVDDGSTDQTVATIKRLRGNYPQAGLIELRRNFGKAAALSAGFAACSAPIVFTLDGDLQDDPNEVPNFLAELDRGFDCVTGWKVDRLDPIDKTLPSRIFNFMVRKVTGVYLKDINCGFKAYRREALEGMELIGEMHRFIPVLLSGKGFTTSEIGVNHRKRMFGKSKYGFTRMFKGIFDLLTVVFTTRFRSRPLHVFGTIGFVMSGIGVLILTYLTVLWLFQQPIGTRPLLQLGVLMLLIGTNFVGTGLIAELVQRSSSSGPSYSIKNVEHPQAIKVAKRKSTVRVADA
jgi:glycosyltransferase involved in cell wall biosynthesis